MSGDIEYSLKEIYCEKDNLTIVMLYMTKGNFYQQRPIGYYDGKPFGSFDGKLDITFKDLVAYH